MTQQKLSPLEQLRQMPCRWCGGEKMLDISSPGIDEWVDCPDCQDQGQPTGLEFWMLTPILEKCRFLENGCVQWEGGTNGKKGYGLIKVGNRRRVVHRVVWEMINGLVPEGLQLDHLCRNRLCINPDHLEAVTAKENTYRGEGFAPINAQKTHCASGHEYNQDNTLIIHARGVRQCRECNRLREKGRRERMKAAALLRSVEV